MKQINNHNRGLQRVLGLVSSLAMLGFASSESVEPSEALCFLFDESAVVPLAFVYLLFSVLFLVFSAKSFDRTMAWKDDFTLATTDVKVSPESVKSNAMAGDEYRRRADNMQNIAQQIAKAEVGIGQLGIGLDGGAEHLG